MPALQGQRLLVRKRLTLLEQRQWQFRSMSTPESRLATRITPARCSTSISVRITTSPTMISGYLTGYPLTESGYYAFARTWPAPEMPRPGCVWTHTILIEFSDIPSLQSAIGLLGLFRRPRGKDLGYGEALTLSEVSSDASPPDPAAARRILWAIYGNPSRPIVSSILEQRERDEFVLAMWDQQWPRLKRAFRFCTLSFADRSGGGNVFDLQFLPGSGRVPRVQFRTALDADRSEAEFSDWLDDAVSDLRDGAAGDLRRFLRTAGSDVSGREAFVPLASLPALSIHLATIPDSVDRAISLLEETIPDSQGHAARSLSLRDAFFNPRQISAPRSFSNTVSAHPARCRRPGPARPRPLPDDALKIVMRGTVTIRPCPVPMPRSLCVSSVRPRGVPRWRWASAPHRLPYERNRRRQIDRDRSDLRDRRYHKIAYDAGGRSRRCP
jgi:hypothetical protein